MSEESNGIGCFGFLSAIFVVLLILKIGGFADITWWQVFTPYWIIVALPLAAIVAVFGLIVGILLAIFVILLIIVIIVAVISLIAAILDM